MIYNYIKEAYHSKRIEKLTDRMFYACNTSKAMVLFHMECINDQVEIYFKQLEKVGFNRTDTIDRREYRIAAEKGTGGFDIVGDVQTCYASISSFLLFKHNIILIENITEPMISVGLYSQGSSFFVDSEKKCRFIDHGLNVLVNYPPITGVMRIKAQHPFVCNSIILREQFLRPLVHPDDDSFFTHAAAVLNTAAVHIPALSVLCMQLSTCTLSGKALNAAIIGKGYQIFALIYDYVYHNKKNHPPILPPEDRFVLMEVKTLLEAQFRFPPTITVLSDMFRMNRQKLTAGFKQLTGFTIYGYVKKLRMEKAFLLLRDTELPVSDIAREVGYHGDGHFQQAFTDFFDAQPLKTRKSMRALSNTDTGG